MRKLIVWLALLMLTTTTYVAALTTNMVPVTKVGGSGNGAPQLQDSDITNILGSSVSLGVPLYVHGVASASVAEFISSGGTVFAMDQYGNTHFLNQNQLGFYYDNNVGAFALSTTGSNSVYITTGESGSYLGNIYLWPNGGGQVISSVYHSINAVGGITAQSGIVLDPTGNGPSLLIPPTGTADLPASLIALARNINWPDLKALATSYGGDHSGINWESFGT